MNGPSLTEALVAVRADMPAVPKTAKAVYGNYATLDDIIAKTKDVLTKHGLTIVQMPVALDNGQPGLKTTILHTSGESISATMPLLLGKQDMQQLGSAITYGRRYAWAAALGIASEHDDDAQGLVEESKGGQSDAMRDKANAPSRPVSQTPDSDTGESASSTSTFRVPDGVQKELNQQKPPPPDLGNPEDVAVHFGKNAGKRLGDLSKKSQAWYAENTSENTPDDRRLKAAARLLVAA